MPLLNRGSTQGPCDSPTIRLLVPDPILNGPEDAQPKALISAPDRGRVRLGSAGESCTDLGLGRVAGLDDALTLEHGQEALWRPT